MGRQKYCIADSLMFDCDDEARYLKGELQDEAVIFSVAFFYESGN